MLAAGDPASPQASVALETLCRTYWYPLYAYLRRSGHQPADAEDLVQGFFLHLLRVELLHSVEREGGRFRSFLLTALKHFLWDEKAKAAAQKRGGGQRRRVGTNKSGRVVPGQHRIQERPVVPLPGPHSNG